MHTPLITEDPAQAREQSIGRLPAVTLKVPSDLLVALLAAVVARMGFQIKWVYRPPAGQ